MKENNDLHREVLFVLYSIVLRVILEKPACLFPRQVHGWIYENMKESPLAQRLHQEKEKSFSVQFLTHGLKREHNLRVCFWHDELANYFVRSVYLNPRFIGSVTVHQVDVFMHPLQHPMARVEAIEQLIPVQASSIVNMDFLTPTVYRIHGHNCIFPDPMRTLEIVTNIWNRHAHPEWIIPEEEKAKLELVDYRLQLKKHVIDGEKNMFERGFMGKTRWILKHPSLDCLKIYNSAFRFLYYTGIGYKSAFGMGQIRIE